MNTAKRGKGALKQVPMIDPKEEISFISGKRRHDAVASSNDSGKVENPSFLVCEYFDCTSREKFVGVAICLLWGVKACTIEITPFELDTAIVTYKWPQQLASVEKKTREATLSIKTKNSNLCKDASFCSCI